MACPCRRPPPSPLGDMDAENAGSDIVWGPEAPVRWVGDYPSLRDSFHSRRDVRHKVRVGSSVVLLRAGGAGFAPPPLPLSPFLYCAWSEFLGDGVGGGLQISLNAVTGNRVFAADSLSRLLTRCLDVISSVASGGTKQFEPS